MIVKQIVDEDVVNYKKTSMVIAFPHCSFKCGDACQNKHLADSMDVEISIDDIVDRYMKNKFSQAVVMQGLEPLDSIMAVFDFLIKFRKVSNDDVVIYTGYDKNHFLVNSLIHFVQKEHFDNVILKVGGYNENDEQVFDKVLGVTLASSNQYAFKI